MNLPGVADVLGAKFVIGGEWSEPDVAAKALEKKTARRKLGLDYTDEDYTRSYVEGHQIAARFRAESDPLFRQVLVKLSQEGAMPV